MTIQKCENNTMAQQCSRIKGVSVDALLTPALGRGPVAVLAKKSRVPVARSVFFPFSFAKKYFSFFFFVYRAHRWRHKESEEQKKHKERESRGLTRVGRRRRVR
ncbi:hypothetical protein [Pandoravirus japonicus]|uniref:Uncharacterized protein n=1 Tax=Pandoravirus japonicus TaxID=2823154 RepID=A0A811BNS1_9VIRU|nr:hypothetical protein [Pandoravirus japonicus]